MKFKAVMMDFDGTVTKKGSNVPSKKMIETLIEVAKKVPIAFCTGRQLESFKRRGFKAILKSISPKDCKVLENIFLIGENGSMGYYYDKKICDYKEFYRAKWPEKFVSKRKLSKIITSRIAKFGEIIKGHRVVMVLRGGEVEQLSINKIYKNSAEIFKICHKTLSDLNQNYEKYLHIGDSGLGVIICPADGDKDTGIKKFADFLAKKKKIKFGKNYREMLVIGDSAKKGGNDYYFLKGIYGTPFTVGFHDPKAKIPYPAINPNGKRLLHDTGTIMLLQHNL